MPTAQISLSINVSGLTVGSESLGGSYQNMNAVGTITKVNLTTTPTALSIPSGAKYILVQPPSGNTSNLKVSGAAGETTGAVLDPVNFTLLALPDAGGSVYLFAAAPVSGVTVVFV